MLIYNHKVKKNAIKEGKKLAIGFGAQSKQVFLPNFLATFFSLHFSQITHKNSLGKKTIYIDIGKALVGHGVGLSGQDPRAVQWVNIWTVSSNYFLKLGFSWTRRGVKWAKVREPSNR